MQISATCCILVQIGADLCRLVKFGATWSRSYKDVVMRNNYHINLKNNLFFKKQLLKEDF